VDGNQLIAIGAMGAGLLTAAAGAYASIIHARRDQVKIDRTELRELRAAWYWAVRMLMTMLTFIARLPGVEVPPEWQIERKIEEFDRRIQGEPEESSPPRSS
jgi:hypothetical protein